jgi:hypothetical protein
MSVPPEPPSAGCAVCGAAQLRLVINTRAATLGRLVSQARRAAGLPPATWRPLSVGAHASVCGGARLCWRRRVRCMRLRVGPGSSRAALLTWGVPAMPAEHANSRSQLGGPAAEGNGCAAVLTLLHRKDPSAEVPLGDLPVAADAYGDDGLPGKPQHFHAQEPGLGSAPRTPARPRAGAEEAPGAERADSDDRRRLPVRGGRGPGGRRGGRQRGAAAATARRAARRRPGPRRAGVRARPEPGGRAAARHRAPGAPRRARPRNPNPVRAQSQEVRCSSSQSTRRAAVCASSQGLLVRRALPRTARAGGARPRGAGCGGLTRGAPAGRAGGVGRGGAAGRLCAGGRRAARAARGPGRRRRSCRRCRGACLPALPCSRGRP